MNNRRSVDLFQKAKNLFPGGVNSPVRAFRAVGGQPLFIDRAEGPYLFDVDGNRYIDYVLSWGPMILGHADPDVIHALEVTVRRGTSFGAPSPLALELAELIQSFMPGLEMIRFVNSGTEATMSALRLARAYTKCNKIIKFEGCYHGHADLLLVQAGSGVATLGLPNSPGVPQSVTQDTLVARYNDLNSVEALLEQFKGDIAAIIVEPVAGNMGVVSPLPEFLPGLRQLTQEYGSLLIFDEVMTGFRVHPGGAQTLYSVQPDLTTLGKVIGGGLPVGAYGGKREIMEMIAPSGSVYQAGTLSGNPLAMTAGIATLEKLQDPGVWKKLENAVEDLTVGMKNVFIEAGLQFQQTRVGTMFSTFFTKKLVTDWETANTSDSFIFPKFFQGMLENGVYFAPSQFEAGFISSAHSKDVVEATIIAARKTFAKLNIKEKK